MLANYTTTVSAADSMAEIECLLAEFGASQISKQYEAGKPIGIEFMVNLDGYPLQFRMPIKVSGAHKVLNSYRTRKAYQSPAHAEKVAWRVMRDWIRVQLAMVEMKQAELAQVFMPYAIAAGQTAYEAFRAGRMKELGSGG